MIINGDLTINDTFLMPPNTGYVSRLEMQCAASGEHRIIVNDGGVFVVQGTSMAYRNTKYQSGGVTGNLVLKDPVNWSTGDIISVAPSGSFGSEVESSTITAVVSPYEYTIEPFLTSGWHTPTCEVVNLKRNCIITSTGAAESCLYNYSQTKSNFRMEWTETHNLAGAGPAGTYPIVFHGAGVKGIIDYCSLHHNGAVGIYLFGSSSSTISNSAVCFNSTHGIKLGGDCNLIEKNDCYGNGSAGIYLNSSNNNNISSNRCYCNKSNIKLDMSNDNNLIDANECYLGTDNNIILVDSQYNTIINNVCSFSLYGIWLTLSSNYSILHNNVCYLDSYGLYFLISRYTIAIYNNISGNSYGLTFCGCLDTVMANLDIGKGATNYSGDIYYDDNMLQDETVVFKGFNLYSSTRVIVDDFNSSSDYVVLYNQIYVSTAMHVNKTMQGSGSVTGITTSDDNTLSEFWEIKCVQASPGALFTVKRGTGTVLFEDPGSPASEGEIFTSGSRGVSFDLSPAGDYQVGDVFYFATISASGDDGTQKTVKFSGTPYGTSIGVESGGEIQLIGSSSYPTVLASESGSVYYDFVVSGTINASYYEFSNLTSRGLDIYPCASVADLSGGTFDNIQNSSGDSSFITVEGITSDIEIYGCVFNDAGSTADYKVKADGAGISWVFNEWKGQK